MAKYNISESNIPQFAHLNRILRPPFNRPVHKLIKAGNRSFHFTVTQNDGPQILQGSEYRSGNELHCYQLTCAQNFSEDEPEKNEQNGLFQNAEQCTLEKGKCPHLSDFLHFQVKYV